MVGEISAAVKSVTRDGEWGSILPGYTVMKRKLFPVHLCALGTLSIEA
jgi:hypothetical protein